MFLYYGVNVHHCGGGSAPTPPQWDSEVPHLQAFCPLEICFFLCKTQSGRGEFTGSGLQRLALRVSVRTKEKYGEVL